MVPQPVKAVLMLFPITEATEAAKAEEEKRLLTTDQDASPSVWFTKQTISNACGTIGMLHAFANCPDIKPTSSSFLERFLHATQKMSPEERARFLEYPSEGDPDVEEAHQQAAQTGQTAPPPEDEQVLHPKQGGLVWLVHMCTCMPGIPTMDAQLMAVVALCCMSKFCRASGCMH
jgi:ubiquitin carboxyl-terminal hydrolase L3